MKRVCKTMLAGLLAGCAAPHHPPANDGPEGAAALGPGAGGSTAVRLVTDPTRNRRPNPAAASHTIPIVIALDVYHLTVPFGAVSSNEDFWKHVDEQKLGVSICDFLLKNGIRAGLAHDPDWPWFRGLLGKYPGARSSRGRTQPGREGYVELEMRTGITYQNVFWLDQQGHDVGRTFEKCDDLLGISFAAAPHRPGDAIVKVCPIVRSLQRYFPVTVMNNAEPDVEIRRPEHLFDLRLEVDVPMNDFLIVAPSPRARWPTSIGGTFLTSDGNAEPLEHVLLIVPRTFRTDDPRGASDAVR